MRSRLSAASAALLLPLLACSPDGTTAVESSASAQDKPESLESRASYAIGFNLGSALRDQGVEADLASVRQGIEDGFGGDAPLLTPEEMQAAMAELQTQVQARMAEQQATAGARNLEEGRAFLAENGARDGVTTTSSGLQYEVLETGDGAKPGATDTVTVHYRGTLIDGTEFDSSYGRGEPATFPLNRVIPAWTEGLQLMPVGSKYKLYVPAQLGYGANGAGQEIGPNATLIFEVELIGIEGE